MSWWDRLVAAVRRLFGGSTSTVNAASSASVMIEVPDTVEVEME